MDVLFTVLHGAASMRFSDSVYESAEQQVKTAFARTFNLNGWVEEDDIWQDEAKLAVQVVLDYVARITGGIPDASVLES